MATVILQIQEKEVLLHTLALPTLNLLATVHKHVNYHLVVHFGALLDQSAYVCLL